MRKLSVACFAAIAALAIAGCDDGGDTNTNGNGNTNIPPDASTPEVKCDPACLADEKCDTTDAKNPICVPICNPTGGGCKKNEVCNHTTAECEPISCGGDKCEFGQICADPKTGATGGDTCTCLPDRQSGSKILPDTCAIYGKVCDYDSENPAASLCRLPEAYEPCKKDPGCAGTGFECQKFSDGETMCLEKCTSSADCGIEELCYPSGLSEPALTNHCYFNLCAYADDTAAQKDAIYFNKCDATTFGGTGNDGTCIPYAFENDAGNGTDDVGLCMKYGNAAAGGECSMTADRGDLDGLCGFNEMCFKATAAKGLCHQLCNASRAANPHPNTGNAVCANQAQGCQDVWGLEYDAETWTVPVIMGACFDKCDLFGTDACAADSLGTPRGCTPFSWDEPANSVCWPVAANAPTNAGDNCTLNTSGDPASECGDRLVCLPATENSNDGKCYAYCDLDTCTGGETAECASCKPVGYACYEVFTGAQVGLCDAKQ